MHFITVEPARDEETGQIHGCRLKLQPLLSNNAASAALYTELWHRLRRENVMSSQLDEDTQHIFDASIYFKGVISNNSCGIIDAAILLNNATDTDSFELHHGSAEATVTEWLSRMDSLLIELLQHEVYAPQLRKLAPHFATKAKDRANAKLKDILKAYYRELGLLVDMSDVEATRAKLKEHRRQTFQDGVQAGHIQLECPRYHHHSAAR